MEDGEAVGQDWMVDVQGVMVDKVQHQENVGGVFASLFGLGTGVQLELRYQFVFGGN